MPGGGPRWATPGGGPLFATRGGEADARASRGTIVFPRPPFLFHSPCMLVVASSSGSLPTPTMLLKSRRSSSRKHMTTWRSSLFDFPPRYVSIQVDRRTPVGLKLKCLRRAWVGFPTSGSAISFRQTASHTFSPPLTPSIPAGLS